MTAKRDQALLTNGLIGIVRFGDRHAASTAAHGLIEAAVVPEVTLTTPGACRVIAELSELGHRVLAGTVTSADEVLQCARAGASAIVAPNVDPEVIMAALDQGLEVWPGALTPSELARAAKYGATGVKVFPAASLGGPSYIQLLRGPFPSVPLMATGGIALSDVGSYFNAGCVAVGVGSALIDADAAHRGDHTAVAQRAQSLLANAGLQRIG